ncbi:MAG: hypothetical protein HC822_01255 [Oscillochloris sp.]|nr:hypothetical protein [Oscillochloris sp.]
MLGVMQLPPPALGPQSNLGLHAPALAVVLAAAATGLRARDLLAENGMPQADLAHMLTLAVRGEHQLIFAGRHGLLRIQHTLAWNAQGQAVLHTVLPDRHRLESAVGPSDLLDLIALTTSAGGGPDLTVDATVLTQVIDALGNQQPKLARRILETSDLAPGLIAEFLSQLGPQPGRFSLIAVNMQPEPRVRAAAIVHGARNSWWGEPAHNQPDCLTLRPTDRFALRRAATALYAA